jgi:protein-S-isoprenylcysteine O-methyltransferase Ste14
MDTTTLRREAWAGAAFFAVVLWIIIFASAWSLAYWQGWAYWAIFTLSVILITAHFLRADPDLISSRLKVGPVAEQEKSQKMIQALMSVLFIGLYIVAGLDYRFGWSQLPAYGAVAGDLLLVIGLWIVFLTFRENTFTSAIIEVGAGQTVVSTGPYAYVRHPMYAGASLLLLGTPFALGSLIALVPACLMVAGIAWRLTEEEKFLAANLPGYPEYCRKTRYRLIPYIW